ncbi:NAD-dependent epimerase/dehydratase family protein [Alicyclobacillus dauci]|uniref:SDR family oxidoreductase n=1 Tax=Alicyclobacillus dauci TaxID=1475485 RepID=A0ABY6Z493_9BACL|nr:SDR family oxidoreductase [Alicyclobacillus dauci]WAH37699.1 SDR family oxidoreductase [Alicyclobacillus dauci]
MIGGRGFVGSAIVHELINRGDNVWVPSRDDHSIFSQPLGDVIYAAGVTSDFRSRVLETGEAHICLLKTILEKATFRSLIYLSSTRVYGDGESYEEAPIQVNPLSLEHVYNLTKLTGEALCLHSGRPTKIVRLSNVIGEDEAAGHFFSMLLHEGQETGNIILRSSPQSEKDYIWIDDVVELVLSIMTRGKENIYNVASGKNISHAEVLEWIHKLTGALWSCDNTYKPVIYRNIDIEKIKNEFGFVPKNPFEAFFKRKTEGR